MRFQIATLVVLIVSSNALTVPHRRDSIPTSRRFLETRPQHELRDPHLGDNRLDVRGPNIMDIFNGLQSACAAWTHAKDAGLLQQRGGFGDEIRLDARGPNIKDILNGLQATCRAWTHAKDSGIIQRRGSSGDEIRLNARDRKKESDRIAEKAKKIMEGTETGGGENLFDWMKLVGALLQQASF